jgi:adenosylmethionine-8-amino-7-oxononanoate aminotransferase
MDSVLIAPPLIITDAEIDEVITRLDGALGAVEQTLS